MGKMVRNNATRFVPVILCTLSVLPCAAGDSAVTQPSHRSGTLQTSRSNGRPAAKPNRPFILRHAQTGPDQRQKT